MSISKNSKSQVPKLFMVLALMLTFSLFAGDAWCKYYDFSFTPLDTTALIVNMGDIAEFYVDFTNVGTQDDSYMFYCNTVEEVPIWSASGCFEDVCWGNATHEPVPFASGETDHMHVQVITPPGSPITPLIPVAIDCYLQAVSETTGRAKIVYFTVSIEEDLGIRVMIYTNQNHYKVGDDLIINLRIVNLGPAKGADTYVAFLHGTSVYFFQQNGILSTEVAPYTGGRLYPSQYVDDEVILTVQLNAPLGLDQLVLASVMTDPGTTNLISVLSITTITFE